MDGIAKLIAASATLLWPLIVLLLFWRLGPTLVDIVKTAKSRRVTVKLAGQEFTLEEAAERQGDSVADLLAQVGALGKRLDAMSSGLPASRSTNTRRVDRLLWVDDNPEDNRLYVAQLEEVGMAVDLATTTSAAIGKFETNSYGAVVSDMGRTEHGDYRESAGVELVKALRSLDGSTPIYIFCSNEKARRFGSAAVEAGATEVTTSPVRLLAGLGYGERKNAGSQRNA